MADVIIIAALAAAVFLVLRGGIRRLRSGQCAGGCPGCGSGSCCPGGSCRPGGRMGDRSGKIDDAA